MLYIKFICIKKQEVYDIWTRNGFINPDNFAFLKGKTTSMPILITKCMMEDSKYRKKELHTAQIDLRRAYDMVPYHIKEMALRRLGLPEEGIAMWCGLDATRTIQVVTPHGLTPPIHPKCGAFAQGGEESCMGFVALMSWMSDYIDSNTEAGYTLPTGQVPREGQQSRRQAPDSSVKFVVSTKPSQVQT